MCDVDVKQQQLYLHKKNRLVKLGHDKTDRHSLLSLDSALLLRLGGCWNGLMGRQEKGRLKNCSVFYVLSSYHHHRTKLRCFMVYGMAIGREYIPTYSSLFDKKHIHKREYRSAGLGYRWYVEFQCSFERGTHALGKKILFGILLLSVAVAVQQRQQPSLCWLCNMHKNVWILWMI